METGQVSEWAEAQKINVSIDLVEAAKTHLNFLAAIDQRNRFLYQDHALKRAIFRYNAFWLPLLAKHSEKPVSEESLVVPLDCELIWHCHRLNPMRYKLDCERLFGKLLGNDKVVSSLKGTSKCTTEKIWKEMYPEEPYELDLTRPFSKEALHNRLQNAKFTSYDLTSAVKRQMTFTYQATRPHMSDELFLREAEARYKGFLHIIRTNRKMGLMSFSVPTYDVDLMWHTHQLYPEAYSKDTIELVGFMIQHNDSDPDKSKGSRLDTGFSETTNQWEQTFGSSYWKAGALYRGDIPTQVSQVPYEFPVDDKGFNKDEKCGLQIQFPSVKSVEVLLEFVDIKNLPEENKEALLVAFSKNQPDTLFKTKRYLGISSASKDKLFDVFQCEPKGDLLFELMSNFPTSDELKQNKSLKLLGSCSLSAEQLLASRSQLTVNKWVSIDLVSGLGNSDPLLHVSVSFSPPMTAHPEFQLSHTKPLENDQVLTHVMDDSGKKVFSLQKRNIVKDATTNPSDLFTEVYCISDSSEKHVMVERHGDDWIIKGTHGSFKVQTSSGKDDSLFEIVGHKMVKIYPGRRLAFEPKKSENEKSEQDFATAVEFSKDYPYGKAVALINSKSGTIKAIDESMMLPGIALTFILSNIPREAQCGRCVSGGGGVLGLVKAADCACGPCKTTQMENNGILGLVKAADCACGPCKTAQTDNDGISGLVKAADCLCGPCSIAQTDNDGVSGLVKAPGCGPCFARANIQGLVKAADCLCGPCSIAQTDNDGVSGLVKAPDCGPCFARANIQGLVKAADCLCGPCSIAQTDNDGVSGLVKAPDCGPCFARANIQGLVKAADCLCGPCSIAQTDNDGVSGLVKAPDCGPCFARANIQGLVKAADCLCGPCSIAQTDNDGVSGLVKAPGCGPCFARANIQGLVKAADCLCGPCSIAQTDNDGVSGLVKAPDCGPCFARANIQGLVKAADCLCGPCSIAQTDNDGVSGLVKAPDCGPCFARANIQGLVKAADCLCGPCSIAQTDNDGVSGLVKAPDCGPCFARANIQGLVKAADCLCGPCSIAQTDNDGVSGLVKAPDCGPCFATANILGLVKAA